MHLTRKETHIPHRLTELLIDNNLSSNRLHLEEMACKISINQSIIHLTQALGP